MKLQLEKCLSLFEEVISGEGYLIFPLTQLAHKDTITCIASSKDSKRFATCSLDKTVVIWKYNPNGNPKIVAELKYTQADTIHCLAFNPLTS